MGGFCCLGVSVVVGVLLVNLEMMNRNYVNMYVFMIFIKICVDIIEKEWKLFYYIGILK